MSTIVATGVQIKTDDWLIAGIALAVCFLLLYPVYILYLRILHSRRIASQLVTSSYKLPLRLTPVELSYIFSTKINNSHMFATLLDLTNRGILIMNESQGKKTVKLGPKIEDNLLPFEKMLVGYVHQAGAPMDVRFLLKGSTTYVLKSGDRIQGSRQYVFWWLLRQSLRDKKIIEKSMTGRYTKILIQFAVLGGLIASVVPLLSIRVLQMLHKGEVDISSLTESLCNGLLFWAISIAPLLIISFALLRFRGKMLGREWLMTKHSYHYLGQLDAYREFVRLVHKGKLRFDSKNMEKESKAETRPYAIALGYIKQT